MLRRIPYTLLVCLVLLASLTFLSTSWAVAPDESLDVLLKPNNSNLAAGPVVHQAKAKRSHLGFPAPVAGNPYFQGPSPIITKVKAPQPSLCAVTAPGVGCLLPMPRPGQWQIGYRVYTPVQEALFNGHVTLGYRWEGPTTRMLTSTIAWVCRRTGSSLRSTPDISFVGTGPSSTQR